MLSGLFRSENSIPRYSDNFLLAPLIEALGLSLDLEDEISSQYILSSLVLTLGNLQKSEVVAR